MKKPEMSIHQLLIDDEKLDRLSIFHDLLCKMSGVRHAPSNRQQFWAGGLNAANTIIEILDIENHLRKK